MSVNTESLSSSENYEESKEFAFDEADQKLIDEFTKIRKDNSDPNLDPAIECLIKMTENEIEDYMMTIERVKNADLTANTKTNKNVVSIYSNIVKMSAIELFNEKIMYSQRLIDAYRKI